MGGAVSYFAARGVLAIAIGIFAVAGLSEARVAPKPNLRVASVGPAARTVTPGGKLTLTETTANAGRGRAGKSVTAIFLSSDARRDARDRKIASVAVQGLNAGKRAKKTLSVAVPASLAGRVIRLIACADDRRKVRETKEGDNCRTAVAAVSVTLLPLPNLNPGGEPTPTPGGDTPPAEPGPGTPDPNPPAPADASAQIQALRDAPDGTVSLPVAGAVVTYVKPALGSDPAGFFIQAAQAGPALFVAVDPATLTPSPAAGDRVNFTVTSMGTTLGLREATALSGFARSETGVNVAALKQSVSASADLVSGVGSYESELVSLTGTVAGAFVGAGAGHESAPINTTGISGDANLRLRLPSTLRDTLDLEAGCTFTLDAGPMWRNNAVAQPSAYSASDLTPSSCPAPTVMSAVATSSTAVTVTFSRRIDPGSVAANGSQFTADNGLTFSAAATSARTVTLTSSAQTIGVAYTVNVASSVTDLLGTGVDTPSSAVFDGFVQPADLILNEINPAITSSHDLIELKAISGGSVKNFTISQAAGTPQVLATMPDVVVATGDLIVVHLVPDAALNGDASSSETTSKNQNAHASFSANYDNAWDFLGGATGLTNNDRVVTVRDAADSIVDAVPFILTAGMGLSGFPPELQAIQNSGDWLPANCSGMPCDYTTTPTARQVSVSYTGAGNSPTTNSISRKNGFNTKQNTDWNAAGAQTFGADNP